MKEIKEVDVSEDIHTSIESNPDDVLITFKTGNKIRISWDLLRAIETYDKK